MRQLAILIFAAGFAVVACSSSSSGSGAFGAAPGTNNPEQVMRVIDAKPDNVTDNSDTAEGVLPSGDTVDCSVLTPGDAPYGTTSYDSINAAAPGVIFSSSGGMACTITAVNDDDVDDSDNVEIAKAIGGTVDGVSY